MPTDPFVREKFAREPTAAKKLAAEYFQRFPKDQHRTEVDASCSAVHGFVCLRRKAATGEQARNIAASWQAQHNRSAAVDRLYDALAFAVLPSSSPNSPATCFRRFATSPDNSALADSTS